MPRTRVAITPQLLEIAARQQAESGVSPEWYEALKADARPTKPTNAKSAIEAHLLAAIIAAGLPEPVAQFKWCHGRRFAADFAYPEEKILIEVQGGVYLPRGGRHNRGAGYEADRAKINEAQLQGWRVLEFGPSHVKDGTATATVKRALESTCR